MADANIIINELASTTPDRKIKVAKISGQLDESNVDEKVQVLYKVLEDNPQHLYLILDMENLEYMNSKSIGYLTDIYGKVTQNLGQVAIAKARPNILDILQVVGLTQLIKVYNSIEEASASASSANEADASVASIQTASPQAPTSPVQAQTTITTTQPSPTAPSSQPIPTPSTATPSIPPTPPATVQPVPPQQ